MGWQWVFFINVPVITLSLIAGYYFIEPDEKKSIQNRPDIFSGILLTVVIVMLSYVIHELKNLQNDYILLGAMTVAIVVGTRLFFIRSRTQAYPLIDFSMLNRSLPLTGNGVMILMGAFFTGYLFMLSLILQTSMHYSAAQAGLLLFPFSVLSAVVSKSILPAMLKRITMLQAGILGMSLMTLGAVMLLCALAFDYNLGILLISVCCVTGTGIAVCFTSLTVIAIQDIPVEHHGLAASVTNTCYFFGAGLGLSILSLFMQSGQQVGILTIVILGIYAGTGAIWLITYYRRTRFSEKIES
jgi:MFS family permease